MRQDGEKTCPDLGEIRIGTNGDVPRDLSIFRAKIKCVKPLKIRVVGLYDAVNLDKVCTAARIKPWLFGGYSETWLSG